MDHDFSPGPDAKPAAAGASQREAHDLALLNQLSKRERQALALIACGATTRVIGKTLGISYKTAVTHRTNLMTKLGIHDVANLTRFAIRTRVIDA